MDYTALGSGTIPRTDFRRRELQRLAALKDAPGETLLTIAEYTALMNITRRTENDWHRKGVGPRRILIEGGARPRYRLSDVRAFLDAQASKQAA